jgi:hypothetical protein
MVDGRVTVLLPIKDNTNIQKKNKYIPMPQAGFKPMIPMFERQKTVYALDRAATVIG